MRNHQYLSIASLFALVFLAGCSSMYYGAMEKVGIHKRDIMVDRVEEARDSQQEAKEQFLTTMQQFKSVVDFEGGELEKAYSKFSSTLQDAEEKAAEVRERIESVEDVSEALFDEWRIEITQYSSDSLRRSSQQKFDATRQKYLELISAMKHAESKLEPALVPLRDQVLFMKHNLNARAIAGLKSETKSVQANVDTLVRSIENAVARADEFIASLEE